MHAGLLWLTTDVDKATTARVGDLLSPAVRLDRGVKTVSLLRSIGSLAVASLLVIGCGGDTPDTSAPAQGRPPALLADLLGPWRSEPLTIPDALAAAADRVCRADPAFPAGVTLALIDARGAGKLMAYYDGPAAGASCEYLEVSPTGEVTGSISSTWTGQQPGAAPGRLESGGSSGSTDAGGTVWQTASGRAGAGIAHVVIVVDGVGPVSATLRNGWFSAWWPVGRPLQPMNAPGPGMPSRTYVVTAYDALGQPIDTTSSP